MQSKLVLDKGVMTRGSAQCSSYSFYRFRFVFDVSDFRICVLRNLCPIDPLHFVTVLFFKNIVFENFVLLLTIRLVKYYINTS